MTRRSFAATRTIPITSVTLPGNTIPMQPISIALHIKSLSHQCNKPLLYHSLLSLNSSLIFPDMRLSHLAQHTPHIPICALLCNQACWGDQLSPLWASSAYLRVSLLEMKKPRSKMFKTFPAHCFANLHACSCRELLDGSRSLTSVQSVDAATAQEIVNG